MATFTCSYRHDGGEYAFDIHADSHADAERRLGAIKAWGKVDGEVIATIPAFPGASWLTPVICKLRNVFAVQG